MFETEIQAVETRDGQQFLALDEAPRPLRDDVIPPSKGEPIDVVPTQAVRDELDPSDIHQARPRIEQRSDNRRDAELTTDPLQWASNPDEYDFPGVDTGPRFESAFGDVDARDFGEFSKQF